MSYETVSNDDIQKIHRRQLARLLFHLEKTGQITSRLEKDIKRSFGFTFADIESAIQEQGKEKTNEQQRH